MEPRGSWPVAGSQPLEDSPTAPSTAYLQQWHQCKLPRDGDGAPEAMPGGVESGDTAPRPFAKNGRMAPYCRMENSGTVPTPGAEVGRTAPRQGVDKATMESGG
jgi:hypothetical protein